MNIIVAGPRDFTDEPFLIKTLDHLTSKLDKTKTFVMIGDASGVDYLTREWCFKRGFTCRVFRANWDWHKKAAGPIRNGEMVKEGAKYLIAFQPKGRKTPGTQDMIRQATAACIKVKLVEYEQQTPKR